MTEEAQVIQADRIWIDRGTANSHFFDDRIMSGDDDTVAFSNEPWTSRIVVALAAEREATERAAKMCDAREEMRFRLYEENGADINAHKAVEAEMIAAALRRNEHMEG